jgi:hypothetical protein
MDNPTPKGHGSTYMTILTTMLYVVSKWTLSDGAAIAAIMAGATTAWLNIYRWRSDKRKEKHNNWGKNKP